MTKETLSDKRKPFGITHEFDNGDITEIQTNFHYSEEDVKETLKEFIKKETKLIKLLQARKITLIEFWEKRNKLTLEKFGELSK